MAVHYTSLVYCSHAAWGELYQPQHLKKKTTLYEKYYSLEDVFLNCPCIISESGLKNCLNFLKMSEH